jgi:acyl carrier protein
MMPETMHAIFNLVVDMFGVRFDDVRADQSLTDDLGADSLDTIEFVMAVEEKFSIEILDDIVDTLKTVGDFVNHVEELGL